MSEKKPYLFYYEEACDGYILAPDSVEHIIELSMLEDGETREVLFKRIDLTDKEYDELPDD